MTDIFLSRPTWLPSEYQDGFDNVFEMIQENMDLSPRTIGPTDPALKSPLDEVVELMEKANGALILGYPQIFIDSGSLKDRTISEPTHLATEWNHIEASLAYARKLPLLIIHDLKVSRGVFDRGAINKFIYRTDFKKNSWARSEEINGALKKWKEEIDSHSNGEEYYKYNPIKVSSSKSLKLSDLSKEAENLLKEAYKDKFGQIIYSEGTSQVRISTTEKSRSFKKTEDSRKIALWKKVLEELENFGLINANKSRDGFDVTDSGYKLVEKNMSQ